MLSGDHRSQSYADGMWCLPASPPVIKPLFTAIPLSTPFLQMQSLSLLQGEKTEHAVLGRRKDRQVKEGFRKAESWGQVVGGGGEIRSVSSIGH